MPFFHCWDASGISVIICAFSLWFLSPATAIEAVFSRKSSIQNSGVQCYRAVYFKTSSGTRNITIADRSSPFSHIAYSITTIPKLIGNYHVGIANYTGLTAQNPFVNCVFSPSSFTVQYAFLAPNAQTVNVSRNFDLTITGSVSFNSSESYPLDFTADVAPLTITIDPITNDALVTTIADTTPRKDLILAIFNDSDTNILLGWGNKMLNLKPGLNHFRYDGQVDSNGFPTVKPPDFAGTLIQTPDNEILLSTLKKNSFGGATFGPPPSIPPVSPTATIPLARVYTDTGLGITVGLQDQNGITRTGVIGEIPPRTPSNTTGTTAVISESNVPKSAQTPQNTVVNTGRPALTTNNVNTTIINDGVTPVVVPTAPTTLGEYNGPSKADIQSASTSVDSGLPIEESPDNSGRPLSDISQKVNSITSQARDKFQHFKTIIPNSSIPRATSYALYIYTPFGAINRNLDLTASYITSIRTMIAGIIAMLFARDFMKRATI